MKRVPAVVLALSVPAAFAYVGTVGHRGGVLLWPGVARHAIVPLLLVCTWRSKA
jgi:hypothetical protein